MTDTDQANVIRIAEWCGWQRVDPRSISEFKWVSPQMTVHEAPPSYLTDLNACTEFEGLLEERGQKRRYIYALWAIYGRNDFDVREMRGIDADEVFNAFATVTAAQRFAAMVAALDEMEGKSDG